MKNAAKTLVLVLLLVAVGLGGYYVGANTANQNNTFNADTPAFQSTTSEDSAGDTAASKPTPTADIVRNVEALRKTIERDFLFPIDEKKLEMGIYKGLFEGLDDPYSVFYTAEEYKAMMEDTAGKFGGIGIVVTVGEDNLITVVSPIKNTPGDRAGLQTDDKIIAVDGKSYLGTEQQEAVNHMRGEPGTKVKLTVRRKTATGSETKDFEITREMITIESVESRMLEGDVGYIHITSFDEPTASEFKKHLQQLETQGAKRVVLDLRNNPGGLLNITNEIADYLLGESVIVTTVDRSGKEDVDRSDAQMDPIPMTVLINKGSASASEILAGALMDNNRAQTIGVQSFGKGIVQRLYSPAVLGEGPGYKLTISEYQTPNGTKIHGVGVTPNIVVELPEDVTKIGPDALDTDVQLQRAIEEVKKLN